MEYKYFVDDKPYTTTNKCVTGMYITSSIQGFESGYSLILENRGMPSTYMRPQDTVDLSTEERHFYTFPIGSAMNG